jgi:hypothetical protein
MHTTVRPEECTSITTHKANSIIPRLEFNLFFLVNKFHCEDRCVSERQTISDNAYEERRRQVVGDFNASLEQQLAIGVRFMALTARNI